MNHDAPPGPLNACQITGSTNLFEIIDLGHQPLCDSLLTKEQLSQPETTYPLKLMMCPESGLAQLSYVVDGSTVYHPAYPYRSGISAPLAVYQRAFAADVVNRLDTPAGSLVVDIGSNDGTLLSGFKKLGMEVLGVEPTNIAELALAAGITTARQFFNEDLAKDIVHREYGHADIITATNVFAHMADLGEVMRGIDALLAPDGVFITESHYLLDVLEKNQFDTIYHEHIRTYSLKSLCVLFEQYGMEVFDVQRASRYGGNIRAYVARKGTRPICGAVNELLAREADSGLFDPDRWATWLLDVQINRDKFLNALWAGGDLTVIGKGCPGRAMTLLNYYGITKDKMPYIAELPTSLKLGMYTPGGHIPIKSDDDLLRDQPEFVVSLSWHYHDYIRDSLKAKGLRSKWIKPLPEFKVID
jgi:SAM-dependent methyltransferase